MVKRLRHRPFTAVTRVRFPFGSPLYGRIAQLVRAPASHAGGQRFESVYAHQRGAVHTLVWAALLYCTKTDPCRCLLERPSGLSVAARNARCRGHKRFESVYAHQLRTVHTSVWAVLNLCVITEPMPLPPRKAEGLSVAARNARCGGHKRFESVYAHQRGAVHTLVWAALLYCTKTDPCCRLLERPKAFHEQLAAACASKTPEMPRSKRFELRSRESLNG